MIDSYKELIDRPLAVHISDFCSTVGYKRRYSKPWVYQGFECAGDGTRFAFRVTEQSDANPLDAPDATDLIAQLTIATLDRTFPSFDLSPNCTMCAGTGIQAYCGECEGEGNVYCSGCERSYICDECDGTGTREDVVACNYCVHGFQVHMDGRPILFNIPGTEEFIALDHARLLSLLHARFNLSSVEVCGRRAPALIWQGGSLFGLVVLAQGVVPDDPDEVLIMTCDPSHASPQLFAIGRHARPNDDHHHSVEGPDRE